MAPSFSTTKGVASTLLHILADRGLVDYDDRVADYWPEFAQAGKAAITVRQVLSHQSGLYHIRRMIDDAHRMLDWAHMIEAIDPDVQIGVVAKTEQNHSAMRSVLPNDHVAEVTVGRDEDATFENREGQHFRVRHARRIFACHTSRVVPSRSKMRHDPSVRALV